MTQNEYTKHAEELIEEVSYLQKQILIKHATGLLKELHEVIREKNKEIKDLKLKLTK